MAGSHRGHGSPTYSRRPTRPAAKPPLGRPVWLREDYVYGTEPHNVDEAAKVIHHVKVLGRTSPNTHGMRGAESTAYTDDALQSLASWINESGFKVNVNHVPKDSPDRNRKAEDRLGKLIPGTAVVEQDGVYADLRYLSAHPMSALIVEAAKEMPDCFGLSINAFGRGDVRGGVYVIREIVKQPNSSVDVVANAGTVTSLFESRQDPMKTPQKPAKAPKTRLREDDLSMGSLVPDMEDDTTGEVSPEDQLKAGFRAAIMSIVDDDTMDTNQKCEKINNYIKTHAKLTNDEKEDDGDGDEDGDETEESRQDTKPGKGVTALREELDALKRREQVREECGDFHPTKPLFEALCAMSDPKSRKSLIEEQRKLKPTPAAGTPRSSPRPVQESRDTNAQSQPAADAKSFAQLLKSR